MSSRVGALLVGLFVAAVLTGNVGLIVDSQDYDFWGGWAVLAMGPPVLLLAILVLVFFYAVAYTLVHGELPEWLQ